MTTRHVRRRDFSRHWAFTGRGRRLFRFSRRLIEWPPLPPPLFLAALVRLAWAGARGRTGWTWILALFMAGDALLLALLPRFGRSYGAWQPATAMLAVLRAGFAWIPLSPGGWIGLQLLGTALVVYGGWVEPHSIGVTHQRLQSRKLKPGAPLRLLHFGDLHVERITARERQLVERVATLRPDLVVFTGDLLSVSFVHDPAAWASCRWVFERLSAPLGVFVVSGSSAGDPDDVVARVLEGLPVRWLRDEKVTIEHQGGTLELIGIGCTHRPFEDRRPLERLLSTERFTVLLYHSPDLAPDAAELGVDLMLSGHTHGGQIRLPGFGALVTSSLYGKAFEMGRYQQDGLTLYVTRGLGMEGSGVPRFRLLCPPEVVLWEIDGSSPDH